MTTANVQYKIYESLNRVKDNLGLHLDVFDNYKKVAEHLDIFQETYSKLFDYVNDLCNNIEASNIKQKIKFGINIDDDAFEEKNRIIGYFITSLSLSIARFYAENSVGGGAHNNILGVLDKNVFFEYNSEVTRISNELRNFHIVITYINEGDSLTKAEKQKYINIVEQLFKVRKDKGIDVIYYNNDTDPEILKNIVII